MKTQKENSSEVTSESKTTNNTDEISKKPLEDSKSIEEDSETEKKSTETQKTTNKKAVYFHPKIQSQRLKSL